MPLLGPNMEDRNLVFHKLKSPCVALSRAALSLNAPSGNLKTVTTSLEDLTTTLQKITTKPDVLDAKLADYCFFPLSQVLKASKKVSLRCLELCLQCIALLVEHGWRNTIQPQLAAQIVILCTLMAERKPKGFSFSESTDELQAQAFWCLHHAFAAGGESRETKQVFGSEANFAQLGQTISVMLDGIHDGRSAQVQIAATEALLAFVEQVADRELCARFLPGIVSRLTRVLRPSTEQRRNHRVLIGSLRMVGRLLRMTLDDDEDESTNGHTSTTSIIDEDWKSNAATQLKPTLTSIVRLNNHSRDDVRAALSELCLALLEHCRLSLSDCSTLLLETLITQSSRLSDDNSIKLRLEALVRLDASISRLLQDVLYDWLQSLPTILQSVDEQAKTLRLQQIRTTYELLEEANADASMIDKMLAGCLRDGIVITLQQPRLAKTASSFVSPVQSLDIAVLDETKGAMEFNLPLVTYPAQESIMVQMEQLAHRISASPSSTSFTADLARSLRTSQGDSQLATFWLLLTSVRTQLQRKDAVSEFMDVDSDSRAVHLDHLEELYSFSLSILSDPGDSAPDPRLQALALRTLALRAEIAGQEFKYELLDALYPVLHTLATPSEHLQRDSITTLNLFVKACGYASVRELIVENVDYLTNAVALKLNAFDIGPQAPQVLLMMVRLAGPGLLPYLEDTVESIFAALEDYHGYPLLVELLFRVLGVMAEEGVKAPLLRVEGGRRAKSWAEERWRPISIDDLALLLRERKEDEAKMDGEGEKHPRRPWKDVEERDDDVGTQDESDIPEDQPASEYIHPLPQEQYPSPALTLRSSFTGTQDQQLETNNPSPPAPKTYNLLFKITELTQHFLPISSPSLRTSLLGLIRTTIPAIAAHEDTFLPLINTLWPEIISRLDDAESYVRAAALEIVGMLCEYAGDFMLSRIIQVWPVLVAMHGSLPEAVVSTLSTIVQHVHLPPSLFDEAMDLLNADASSQVMEMVGEDTLWLMQHRRRESRSSRG